VTSVAHSAKHVLVLSYFPVSCLTVILVALKDVVIIIGAIRSEKSSGGPPGCSGPARDNFLLLGHGAELEIATLTLRVAKHTRGPARSRDWYCCLMYYLSLWNECVCVSMYVNACIRRHGGPG
jgi:hypothetical protein